MKEKIEQIEKDIKEYVENDWDENTHTGKDYRVPKLEDVDFTGKKQIRYFQNVARLEQMRADIFWAIQQGIPIPVNTLLQQIEEILKYIKRLGG